jgi:Predicted permeases
MLPTATAVATMAISSGIGGAALFGPIFLIIFPTLGPQYPLTSPAAAVAVAILVECFGFSSGLLGYYRRGLVDTPLALKFAMISVPAAITAASLLAQVLSLVALKICYSVLMIGLSVYLLSGGVALQREVKGFSSSTSETVRRDIDANIDSSRQRFADVVCSGSCLWWPAGGSTSGPRHATPARNRYRCTLRLHWQRFRCPHVPANRNSLIA